MKAENKTTGHNRTIRFTDLGLTGVPELVVCIIRRKPDPSASS